jgi:pimeloyl-ACP methyl ester carboxylesterase
MVRAMGMPWSKIRLGLALGLAGCGFDPGGYGLHLDAGLEIEDINGETPSLPDAADPVTTVHMWVPASPPRNPLVLLHGFGASATWQWYPYLRPLIAAGFDPIVPDLVFFGNSCTRLPDRSDMFQVALPDPSPARSAIRRSLTLLLCFCVCPPARPGPSRRRWMRSG